MIQEIYCFFDFKTYLVVKTQNENMQAYQLVQNQHFLHFRHF